MNNRNNRLTGVIVVSASLLMIIVLAFPWVDEYQRLRRGAAQMDQLQSRFAELRRKNEQLDRIEAKLESNLQRLRGSSVDASKTELVRETMVQIVRKAGAQIRQLEIPEAELRPWAISGDDVQSGSMPIYGEPSRFELHTTAVELQVEGSLPSIEQILSNVADQGWLMTTQGLSMTPTSIRESPVRLELQLVLYGLVPREHELEEEFARRDSDTELR